MWILIRHQFLWYFFLQSFSVRTDESADCFTKRTAFKIRVQTQCQHYFSLCFSGFTRLVGYLTKCLWWLKVSHRRSKIARLLENSIDYGMSIWVWSLTPNLKFVLIEKSQVIEDLHQAKTKWSQFFTSDFRKIIHTHCTQNRCPQ